MSLQRVGEQPAQTASHDALSKFAGGGKPDAESASALRFPGAKTSAEGFESLRLAFVFRGFKKVRGHLRSEAGKGGTFRNLRKRTGSQPIQMCMFPS